MRGQASLDDDNDLKKVNYIIEDLKKQANYIIEDLKEDLKKQASYIKDLKEDLKKQVGDIEDLKEQVEEMRHENAQLRRKLGKRSQEELWAAWSRFTSTLVNSRDTQESLAALLECSQSEAIQRHLTDALRLLSKPHGAAGAAKAYRCMCTCPDQPCTHAWKASAVGLRANVILRCWRQADCSEFSSIEAVLKEIYGEQFRKMPNLRSQLLKAYDHLFPGTRTETRARAGARAARKRPVPESAEVQPLSAGPAETVTQGVAWPLQFDFSSGWFYQKYPMYSCLS